MDYRENLKKAILKQADCTEKELRDYVSHGADSCIPGFTYYTDTCDFYKKHRKSIMRLAEEWADDMGMDMIKMIKDFNCIKGDFTPLEIAKVISGRNVKYGHMVKNALVWFAIEYLFME